MTELLKKYEKAEKVCLDCGNPLPVDYPVDEELCADCKLKKLQKAEKIIPEIKVEETKVEAEVKLEEVVKTTPEETVADVEVKPEIVEEVKAEDANVVKETKVETTVTVIDPDKTVVDVKTVETRDVVDDQGNQVEHVEEKSEETQVYTYQQVLEQVAAAKVELEKVLAEKDTEIEKLKQELEVAKQPKEIVKANVEETTPLSLTVGEVTTTDNDKYREIQKSVNRKAYGHD